MLGYTGLGLNDTAMGLNDPSMGTQNTSMGDRKSTRMVIKWLKVLGHKYILMWQEEK